MALNLLGIVTRADARDTIFSEQKTDDLGDFPPCSPVTNFLCRTNVLIYHIASSYRGLRQRK